MADGSSRGEKSGFGAFLQALVSPLITVGIALVVTLLTLVWDRTTPARFVENLTYDIRMALSGPTPRYDVVVVKMDDPSMEVMQQQSACHCFAPADKAWIGDLVATLAAKGAKAVALDILFSSFRSDEEYTAFADKVKDLRMPIIAAVDPELTPDVDYKTVPNLRYVSPASLVTQDDDVVRVYDPRPQGLGSIAGELARVLGVEPPRKPFIMRYRHVLPRTQKENRGAIVPSFPAAEVRDLPDTFFKNKIVLIGRVTRFEEGKSGILEDMHTTPLRFFTAGHEDGTPGVEVHAHALDQMRSGDQVIVPSLLWAAISVFVAALGGAWLGRSTFRWWIATGIVLGTLLVGMIVAYAAFARFGVMVGLLAPLTAFALCFFIQSRLAASQLQEERRLYSTALERYLAPQVIQRIESGEPMTIGAERREITVMVSDIENFSVLVGNSSPEELAMIMNGYFDGLYEVLWKHEAMLDKLTGDGVIVLFGAPFEYPDHADRAIACARDIVAFSEVYRHDVETRFGHKLGRTRIGLHSGECLVGNFGGEKRFNYTAYGQVVVIAARLEAANKEKDTHILMSDSTLKLAKNPGEIRDLGPVNLKGVVQAISAYTPV